MAKREVRRSAVPTDGGARDEHSGRLALVEGVLFRCGTRAAAKNAYVSFLVGMPGLAMTAGEAEQEFDRLLPLLSDRPPSPHSRPGNSLDECAPRHEAAPLGVGEATLSKRGTSGDASRNNAKQATQALIEKGKQSREKVVLLWRRMSNRKNRFDYVEKRRRIYKICKEAQLKRTQVVNHLKTEGLWPPASS